MNKNIGLPPIDRKKGKKISALKRHSQAPSTKFVSFKEEAKNNTQSFEQFYSKTIREVGNGKENKTSNSATSLKSPSKLNEDLVDEIEKSNRSYTPQRVLPRKGKLTKVAKRGSQAAPNFENYLQNKLIQQKEDDKQMKLLQMSTLKPSSSSHKVDAISTTDSVEAKSPFSSEKLELVKNTLSRKKNVQLNRDQSTASPLSKSSGTKQKPKLVLSPEASLKYNFECYFCLNTSISDPNKLKCGHVVCGNCIEVIDGINSLKNDNSETGKLKWLDCYQITRKQDLVQISTPAQDENVLNVDIDMDDLNAENLSGVIGNLKSSRNTSNSKLARRAKTESKHKSSTDLKREAIEEIKKEIAIKSPELGKMISELYKDADCKYNLGLYL